MTLEIRLLGPPRFTQGGHLLNLSRRKSMALLSYLAVTRQPQPRDALLGLFWPEFDQSAARMNLRRDLSWLRKNLESETLLTDRLQVALNPEAATWVDVHDFEAGIAVVQNHDHPQDMLCAECAQAVKDAVGLVEGAFMAGFGLPDCAAFEEWLFFQREQRRRETAVSLQRLVKWCESQGMLEEGIEYGRRWLHLDPWHEPIHRTLMRLYALTGQYAAAIRQYHICVQSLKIELGVEPEAETEALFAAIQTKQMAPPPFAEPVEEADEPKQTAPALRHNLPAMPDSFVGRRREIQEIYRTLTQTECRLLTLRGIGGIGKTRLAIQSAAEMIEGEHFPDGLFFVNLAGVETVDYLIPTIAETLNFPLTQAADPLNQLITYLRTKEMLLLLDNFEQLQSGAVQLTTLRQQCPHLKLLVTSRHQLKLAGEFVMVLDGLPLSQNRKSSSAERLFQARAHQFKPQLDMKAEQPFIHAICRLVEGMPLAIEMCAAWAQTLSCREILAEIQQGLDLLEASRVDAPMRHLSIRAVFQTSFNWLTPAQQQLLLTLAVFRGGFSYGAAGQVAGAKLVNLRALVEKSLLRVHGESAGTRYQMHPLLRKFALEKLEPAQLTENEQQHAQYFADLLAQLATKRCSPENQQIVATVFIEVDNLRHVWQWLSNQIQTNQHTELVYQHVANMLPAWRYAYFYKTYYLEGKQLTNIVWQAMSDVGWDVTGTSQQQVVFAKVTAVLAHFCMELSQFDDVNRLSQQALSILQKPSSLKQQPNTEYVSYALRTWARANIREGKLVEAEERLQESVALAADEITKAAALHTSGVLFMNIGDYDKALHYFEEALPLFEQCHQQSHILTTTNAIGAVYGRQRQFEEAIGRYEQVARLARKLGQNVTLMISLNNLAFCLNKIGRIARVESYYKEALAVAKALGKQRWQAVIAQDFGMFLLEQGETNKAEQHIQDGLNLAVALNSQPDVMAGLLPMAYWQAQTGHFEEALVAVGFMMANKMTNEEARTYAADLWEELSSELPAVFTTRAEARLKTANLDDVLALMNS